MDDTSQSMANKMREMIQAKPAIERLKMGCSMYETSRLLVTQAILANHPGISNADLRKELFLRFYSNDFDPAAKEKILKHLERNSS